MTEQLTDPAVAAFVDAVNSGNRDQFAAALTASPTMSDDGTEQDVDDWAEREIFAANGRMDVQSQDEEGRSLLVTYTNDTYGAMHTRWHFDVEGGRVSRFETGQA
jgi:hypothetical protein